MWFLAILFVGSIVASLLLMPKPKTENARASTLDDLQFPRAQEGSPYPIGLGKFRARGPNTLWVGDWEAVPIKKKMKTSIFSSKKVIVGYRYFVGAALAIVLGPGVKILKIWYGKDVLWEGDVSVDGTAIVINKPDLFGGKEKGGGFVGTIRFYSGSWSQTPNAYMEGVIGAGDVTAYRGQCYIVLEKCEIGEQNSLRDISFEMTRYTNSLGILGGEEIVQGDSNPFELLYHLYTADWGGLNVPFSMINSDVFLACAATVFDEGNGMSLYISKSNDGSDLSNEVLRQVDGLLYQDPPTGKIVPKLIREDYNVVDLPVFDESNVITVRKFTSKLWEDTINQMRVTYTNRDKKYEKGSAFEQDLANINAQGRLRSTTQNYPGVTRGLLASELCRRDLAQVSVPTLSAQLEVNREGLALRPGSVFVWSWDEFGIALVVLRVKNFDLGALLENRIVLEVSQDQFAINETVFAVPGAGGDNASGPNDPAVASANVFAIESPYFFSLASALALGSTKSTLLVGASPITGSDEYDVYTSIDTINYNPSEENVVYTPFGVLKTTITAVESLDDGTIASMDIEMDDEDIAVYSATQVANGNGLFFIGDELLAHQGVTVVGATITFANVWRGLLDSIPQAHAINDIAYFVFGDSVVEDQFDYTAAVRVKVLPRTLTELLPLASAAHVAVTLNKRAARPLCPQAIKFDGGAFFVPPALGTGSHTITWANRDRNVLTIRKIVDTTNEYEPGQRTVLRYRLNVAAWTTVLIEPGVVTYTFDALAGVGDTVSYELYSTRDGLDSFSKWKFTAGAAAGVGENPDGGGAAPPDDQDPFTVLPDAIAIVFPFGETIGTYPIDIPVTFDVLIADNFVGSNADVRTNPADGIATFTAYVNGVSVGTIMITTLGIVTFNTAAGALAIAAGSTLTITPPGAEDSAMEGVTFTIAALKD